MTNKEIQMKVNFQNYRKEQIEIARANAQIVKCEFCGAKIAHSEYGSHVAHKHPDEC